MRQRGTPFTIVADPGAMTPAFPQINLYDNLTPTIGIQIAMQTLGDLFIRTYDSTGPTFHNLITGKHNGRLLFNTITDDGANDFQFAGNAKITGNLAVTGSVPPPVLPNVGTPGAQLAKVTTDAQGRVTSSAAADLSSADVTGVLGAGRFPALTGDITTAAGALATTLKNTGTAGTYTRTTFDAQGRQTTGTDNGMAGTVTITTAKLTPGGANGQMVFQSGILISQVQAT